jgi:hypothetical protein
MPDTRNVAQELQEQLVAAMHRGQKQFRKGQEQFRKGREAVNTAIRTGNELAKAVRPNVPALPSNRLHLPQLSTLPSPAKLRAHAQDFAGQVAATQRNLADKALHAAGPMVAEGVTRLNHVAKSFLEQRDQEDHEPLAPRAAKATAEGDVATAETKGEPKSSADDAKPAANKAAKAATAKTSTAKTGTTKSSASRTGSTKNAGSAKASTSKAKN